MRAAVFGASGYGGQVLTRLLLNHPEVTSVLPVSSSAAGRPLKDRDPGIGPSGKLAMDGRLLTREEALACKPEAVFSSLPHGASAEFCEPFLENSVVFDLSADFRLIDPAAHKGAYGVPAPLPRIRSKAVYGLSEIRGEELQGANVVAVPGCYPTCALLPLIPLARAGLITGPVTVNAVSGISGAGRRAVEASLFVERSESALPYNPGNLHRHHPEMVQELKSAGADVPLFFTPHLVPMRRGMAATISMWIGSGREITERRISGIFREAYDGRAFIGLRGENLPDTRDVAGSNRCDFGWRVLEDSKGRGAMLYLFSVIDNLVKGAAGQAVQDFNLRFGFPETAGLPVHGDV